MSSFTDGLRSLVNSLINTRNATTTNAVDSRQLIDTELRILFRMGITARIYRIKASYALNGTLAFDSTADKEFYEKFLAKEVKRACMQQLGFGRGAVVLLPRGDDLTVARANKLTPENTVIRSFSGDLVSAVSVSYDLEDERYYKPSIYTVRGTSINWTRVVDFTYYEPAENDLPTYRYGGVSEAELLYEQIVNDGVIERASGSIIEKNSTLFYKVKGFKTALQNKKESEMLKYFSALETARSQYGAGLLDADDEVEEVSQTLTNVSEVNDMSLRRLAMISGIPVPMLIGENVKGLNSTGDTERQSFEDTIGGYAGDYVIPNINLLMHKFGRGEVKWKGLQHNGASEKVNFETLVLDNAMKMAELGQDFVPYLEKHNVIEPSATDIFDVDI